MPRTFDTALEAPARTVVRSHIVSRLARLLKTDSSGFGFCQTIVPFGGVVRSYTDETGIDQLYELLQGRAPSIAVALGDKSYKPTGGGGYSFTSFVDVLVYFASTHSRALLARQAPDVASTVTNTADPGIDTMMELCEDLLIGERSKEEGNTTPVIKSIRPKREEELLTEHKMTLWMQTYEVEITRTINHARDVTEKLKEFRTTLRTTIDGDEAVLLFNTDNLEPPP